MLSSRSATSSIPCPMRPRASTSSFCATRARSASRPILPDLLEKARNNADIPSVQLIVRAGRITDTLQKQLIEPTEPDLVICGERGLSNIKYVFVGSVSTYLIRNVRCDVLVVKQD